MGGQVKAKPKGGAKAFSTTGRPGEEGGPQPEEATEESAAVALVRAVAEGTEELPERLLLGGGWPCSVTIGRHEDNDAVLPLRRVSKVHCQVALRGFRLAPEGPLHEAAFLRDNSKHGTLVNGFPAFKPWHWLQNGDLLGLLDGQLLDFFRVEYRQHFKLGGHMVTVEDIPREALKPPAALRQPPPPQLAKPFGKEICGRVVDVSYVDEDPPTTYRMRVIGYMADEGFHHVDSKGLSTWDGESFDDTIDLNAMYAAGNIAFVEAPRGKVQARHDDDEDAPLVPVQKRRRGRSG